MALSVRIPAELEKRLSALSKKSHRSKSSFVCEALKEYLEDQEDYYEALAIKERMKKNNEKSYSLEDMMKMLGISQEDLKNVS